MAEWLLYEHDDGRHAVAPSAEAATFATGDPAWHRVGPVEVSVTPAAADQIAELKASIAYQNGLLKKWHDSASAALNELTGNVPETGWARSGYATRAVEHLRTITGTAGVRGTVKDSLTDTVKDTTPNVLDDGVSRGYSETPAPSATDEGAQP